MMRRWIWALLALCSLPLLAADLKPQLLPQAGDLEHILQKKSSGPWWFMSGGFLFRQGSPVRHPGQSASGIRALVEPDLPGQGEAQAQDHLYPGAPGQAAGLPGRGARGSGGRQPDGHPHPARAGDLLPAADRPHRGVGGEPAGAPCLQSHHPAVRPADLGASQLQLFREPPPAQLAVSGAGVAPGLHRDGSRIPAGRGPAGDGVSRDHSADGHRQLQGADLARHDWRPQGPQADTAAGQGAKRLGPAQQQPGAAQGGERLHLGVEQADPLQ